MAEWIKHFNPVMQDIAYCRVRGKLSLWCFAGIRNMLFIPAKRVPRYDVLFITAAAFKTFPELFTWSGRAFDWHISTVTLPGAGLEIQ